MQFTLLVERIFWMEAHMITEAIKNEKVLPDAASASEPYFRRLCKVLSGSIRAIVKKGERKLFHFMDSEEESLQMMGVEYNSLGI